MYAAKANIFVTLNRIDNSGIATREFYFLLFKKHNMTFARTLKRQSAGWKFMTI